MLSRNINRIYSFAFRPLLCSTTETRLSIFTYCKANNVDLSPETNNVRGSIDFKLSRECNQKVLVKVKLSSNNQLEHGFEVQLPIYMTKRKQSFNLSYY